jgi:hypothetical protein
MDGHATERPQFARKRESPLVPIAPQLYSVDDNIDWMFTTLRTAAFERQKVCAPRSSSWWKFSFRGPSSLKGNRTAVLAMRQPAENQVMT